MIGVVIGVVVTTGGAGSVAGDGVGAGGELLPDATGPTAAGAGMSATLALVSTPFVAAVGSGVGPGELALCPVEPDPQAPRSPATSTVAKRETARGARPGVLPIFESDSMAGSRLVRFRGAISRSGRRQGLADRKHTRRHHRARHATWGCPCGGPRELRTILRGAPLRRGR
jgi:hypothetical protein